MIVSVISDGYPKPVRNPIGMDMYINFYPRVRSQADIGCNRGYSCGWIFAISDPNPMRKQAGRKQAVAVAQMYPAPAQARRLRLLEKARDGDS
jgi:hypothetical protein